MNTTADGRRWTSPVHEVDQLVRSAAPLHDEDLAPVADHGTGTTTFKDALWTEILEDAEAMRRPRAAVGRLAGAPVAPTPRGPRPRSSRVRGARRGRLVPLAAVAIVVLGAAGAGASGLFRSTLFDNNVTVAPSDAVAAVDRLGADVPLPPGGGFDRLKATLSREPLEQSERGFGGMLAFNAACQWAAYWYYSSVDGDAEGARSAAAALGDVGSWVPLSSVDGGGVLAAWAATAASAAGGDVAAVRRDLDSNCGPDAGWHGSSPSPEG